MSLRARLSDAVARAAEVEQLLGDPATTKDSKRLAELGREHRHLESVVTLANELDRAETELSSIRELLVVDDPELAEEARIE